MLRVTSNASAGGVRASFSTEAKVSGESEHERNTVYAQVRLCDALTISDDLKMASKTLDKQTYIQATTTTAH